MQTIHVWLLGPGVENVSQSLLDLVVEAEAPGWEGLLLWDNVIFTLMVILIPDSWTVLLRRGPRADPRRSGRRVEYIRSLRETDAPLDVAYAFELPGRRREMEATRKRAEVERGEGP